MPSRRTKFPLILSAFALCIASAGAQAPGAHPIVPRPIQIDSGKVLGVLTADQQVIAYKGIPYAAPPIADLRWRPPQPVARWKHLLIASDFGSHCIQSSSWSDMVFRDPGPSEDCLTLNVWAPSDAKPLRKPGGGLPVMVWIYGGGFAGGGTSESRQDGQFLAHRGVIVVSMNYRLGIFGFFAHPELTVESSHHASGNYGLMDQAAAIEWVSRNIAAFGGDPANITIFGQSAGSESVSAQMASPLAKDLFAKAIGESGGALGNKGFPSRERAEQANVAWAERVFGTSKLFYLRNLTTEELLKAAISQTRPAPHFGPVVNGYFLADSVFGIYAAKNQAHIPVLAGWMANESQPPRHTTAETFAAQASADFGPAAPTFLSLYPASTDAEAVLSAGDYAGDRFIAFGTWAWLEAQAKIVGAPVYRYFFALPSPGDNNHIAGLGAFHSDDIEYVFGTLDSRPGMAIRPEDRKLSDLMGAYWTNFAKSRIGDPNGPGLPIWPAYSAADNWQVMRLDASPAASPDTLRARDLFLDSKWSSPAR